MNLSTVQGWKRELDPLSEWLQYDVDAGKARSITCILCKKHSDHLKYCRNYSRALIDGITEPRKMKKDNLQKHALTEMHAKAMRLNKKPESVSDFHLQRAPILQAFRKAEDVNVSRIRKLIDIVNLLAKTEKPFSMYEDIAALEKFHGVDLGNTYLNEKKAAEFTACIAEILRDDLKAALDRSPYFSIFIDGSIDVANVEREMIYVMYLVDGTPTMKFLRLSSVEHANAEGITQSVREALVEFNLQVDHMVAFCSDGAAVNMGHLRGVAALLKKDAPWLIVIHCLNHVLELAAKDAFKDTGVEIVIEMLNSLYFLYEKSAKRWRELQKIAEIMHEGVRKPQKANGTRWVQHKARACKALVTSYTPIIRHLENQTEDATVPAADKARIKGYLKRLLSKDFVLHLLLLRDVLGPLSSLSESLQKSSTNFLLAMNSLELFYVRVSSLNGEDDDQEPAAKRPTIEDCSLKELMEEIEFGNGMFCGNQLNGRVDVDTFKDKMQSILSKVEECVRRRLGNVHEDPHLGPMKLLDTRTWPRNSKDLKTYGDNLISDFLDFFTDLVNNQGCDTAEILTEWASFKSFWLQNLSHLSVDETWNSLIVHYSPAYPNLSLVVATLLLVPVSNATVERGFSAMGRIKTDHRNRLNTNTLDHLMRITLDGPQPNQHDSQRAAELFFKQLARLPTTQPYRKPDAAEAD